MYMMKAYVMGPLVWKHGDGPRDARMRYGVGSMAMACHVREALHGASGLPSRSLA